VHLCNSIAVVLLLYDYGEALKTPGKTFRTFDCHSELVRIWRIINLLVKIDEAILRVDNFIARSQPAQSRIVLNFIGSIVNIKLSSSFHSSVLAGSWAERQHSTEDRHWLLKVVLDGISEATIRVLFEGLLLRYSSEIFGKSLIAIDQT